MNCPSCQKVCSDDAVECPHCGSVLPAVAPADEPKQGLSTGCIVAMVIAGTMAIPGALALLAAIWYYVYGQSPG